MIEFDLLFNVSDNTHHYLRNLRQIRKFHDVRYLRGV